mmetsp:Transcript_58061/g.149475  ORF Transcript_58061/g.149475 Transcript_58061/m.149475 type:complete len:362 (-) Transcript_58061:217-1302(-)
MTFTPRSPTVSVSEPGLTERRRLRQGVPASGGRKTAPCTKTWKAASGARLETAASATSSKDTFFGYDSDEEAARQRGESKPPPHGTSPGTRHTPRVPPHPRGPGNAARPVRSDRGRKVIPQRADRLGNATQVPAAARPSSAPRAGRWRPFAKCSQEGCSCGPEMASLRCRLRMATQQQAATEQLAIALSAQFDLAMSRITDMQTQLVGSTPHEDVTAVKEELLKGRAEALHRWAKERADRQAEAKNAAAAGQEQKAQIAALQYQLRAQRERTADLEKQLGQARAHVAAADGTVADSKLLHAEDLTRCTDSTLLDFGQEGDLEMCVPVRSQSAASLVSTELSENLLSQLWDVDLSQLLLEEG